MALRVSETIRRLMGWCLMQASMRTDLAVRPAATAALGGGDGFSPTGPGWWHRYHNRLLVAAVAFSAAAAVTFILTEDASGYPVVWMGLALGAGGALGLLLGYRKQYARIAAGEFTRANMTLGLRIVRCLSVPAASILLVALMAYFVQGGMFGQILAFMLGVSLISWTSYGVTILWERQHRATLITERESMYVLGRVVQGERGGEESAWR